MAKPYSPSGSTVTRDDGSEVYPVVYLDADGKVVAKACIPVGHEPHVPDAVSSDKSFTVTADTDLSSKLSNSPANLPNNLPNDPAETAMEKLENVVRIEAYTSDGI